jgi:hypothetical protein
MRLEVILDFEIPIWRYFYCEDNFYPIPNEFIYDKKIYKNSIILVYFGFELTKQYLSNSGKLNENFFTINYPNTIFLCYTKKVLNLFKTYRPKLNACLAHECSFINENLFKIDNNFKKKFDLVVNSGFCTYKNLQLIKNISNVCTIGYSQNDPNEKNILKYIENTYCANFENGKIHFDKEKYNFLSWPYDINKFYNMSKIGGIFSVSEGGCNANTEYLLAGLPVLSCKCSGGREEFYNERNSVLCDPQNESVESSLKEILEKYNNGFFNSELIREECIKKMETDRDNLTNYILEFFKKYTTNIPSFVDLKNSIKYYRGYVNSDNILSEERSLLALKIIGWKTWRDGYDINNS